MAYLNEIFWAESFWLPVGYTWDDMRSTPSFKRADAEDLYVVLPLALLLLFIRVIFEKFFASRFCLAIGVQDVPRKAPEPNVVLEKVFKTVTQKPNDEKVKALSKQLGWTENHVKVWFRRNRNLMKPPQLKKATESCWRFLFYLMAFVYGSYILLKKDWFLRPRQWMEGYVRKQQLTSDVQWYYIVELALYVSLLFSQFIDNKRKDFWQMFVHHIATILLIAFSYVAGLHRIGAVIILLHDASDFWLESAKVANYAKMERTCDILFVLFASVFLITRLFIYPYWVLHGAIVLSWEIIGAYKSYYIFSSLLLVLQILHINWGITILHMAYLFFAKGKIEKDVRSDDEESDLEDKTQERYGNKKKK